MLGHKCSSGLSEPLFALPLSPLFKKKKQNKNQKKNKTKQKGPMEKQNRKEIQQNCCGFQHILSKKASRLF